MPTNSLQTETLKRVWVTPFTLEELNLLGQETLISHLGIVFTEVDDFSLTATMPVDRRTLQPLGSLHGGASCVLAETIGSVAANYCVDPLMNYCVGLDININHIRAVRTGLVTGIATPVHLGRTTQVWEIKIFDGQKRLTALSRLTMAVLKRSCSS